MKSLSTTQRTLIACVLFVGGIVLVALGHAGEGVGLFATGGIVLGIGQHVEAKAKDRAQQEAGEERKRADDVTQTLFEQTGLDWRKPKKP